MPKSNSSGRFLGKIGCVPYSLRKKQVRFICYPPPPPKETPLTAFDLYQQASNRTSGAKIHHHTMYWKEGKLQVEQFESLPEEAAERAIQTSNSKKERKIAEHDEETPLSDPLYVNQYKDLKSFQSTCRRLYNITRYLGVGVIGCEHLCKYGKASAYLELTRNEFKNNKGVVELVQGEFEKVLDTIRADSLSVRSSVNDEAYENYLGIDNIHTFYKPYYFDVVAPHRKQLTITWTPQDGTLMDTNAQQAVCSTLDDSSLQNNRAAALPNVPPNPRSSASFIRSYEEESQGEFEWESETEGEEDESEGDKLDSTLPRREAGREVSMSATATGSPRPVPLPSAAWVLRGDGGNGRKCSECHAAFTSQVIFEKHIKLYGQYVNHNVCLSCGKRSNIRIDTTSERRNHFTCGSCKKPFTKK
ncbi:hypothetical protein DFS34DRAFT_624773 [Phlyctochytrium arcticum]|nr:hypothetical protein DFS34DRAFT_624773 [Phlyctochytrium arcticum]